MSVAIHICTTIAASPEEVWRAVERIETHTEWMLDAESITFRSEQHSGVGAAFDCVTRVGPLHTTDHFVVTRWEPGCAMGIEHRGAVTGTGEFRLRPLAGGDATDFCWEERLTFPWWLAGVAGEQLGRPVLTPDLGGQPAAAEGQGGAPPGRLTPLQAGGGTVRARSVVVAVLTLLATTAATPSGAATSSAATPTIEGPIAGTPRLASTNFDLASVGYEQAEYFLSGTATAYTSATPLSSDGKWTVTPGTTAPYKTRMVVYRPTDPKRFNGTVIVEWNNVSAGLDSAPIWLVAHDELIREGYAWVGVTAQQVGVEGGGRGAVVANLDLKHADPARYGTLVHPGDSYSYDMYTQAGRAVRSRTANVLGGLVAKRVIAAGESQSAFRMTTYIDAVEPLTKGVYDGYFVYSRGGSGAALSQAPLPAIPTPSPTLIRTDLTVPVMTFTTETDLILLGYLPARQPDTKRFRNWEVAGTSHADSYTLDVAGTDTGGPRATPSCSGRCCNRRAAYTAVSSRAIPRSTPDR